MLTEKTMEKLRILAESAKYDVSCSSSGTVRKGKQGMVGSTVGGVGICHSFADDGRCISLLKVMLTNYCMYDCAYCINRFFTATFEGGRHQKRVDKIAIK